MRVGRQVSQCAPHLHPRGGRRRSRTILHAAAAYGDRTIELRDGRIVRDTRNRPPSRDYVPRGSPSTCIAMIPRMISDVPEAMLAARAPR